ncbi:MAG TPA: HAD family hydrolase [Trueperaceae bacterium]|nr:HAD family hydrolase [Trueperaceae bacterium]
MLLAFDLDKTLVTDEYELRDEIAEAVIGARRRGHVVTVLTGRPLVAAHEYLTRLAIDTPHSVNHGSTILAADGTVIARKLLDPADVAAMLARFTADEELEFSCVVGETLYVRDPAHERWTYAHAQGRVVSRYDAAKRLAADKVVFHSNGKSELLATELAKHYPKLIRYLWGDGYLEIVPRGGDKGTALKFIAERLGVAREDIVAFGDGLNDVTMIGWAGHGIAVGNDVHPDVMRLADEHVPSPEEGGVARWLEAHAR